jgi:peroxiredoxin
VIEPGQPVPEATVFDESRTLVTLRELVAQGRILLLFYLFDWSST